MSEPQTANPGRMQAMVQAIKHWMGNSDPGVDARAAAGQGVAEEASKMMPSAVMPRGAIEEQRRRQAMMDQMLRDAGR